MRTIKQLPVPQETDTVKWPYGNIQNETATVQGTPVVREIYGDVLINIYKILEDSGIVASGTEDSETTGYQFLNALKKFANSLNDIEQVLSLAGTVWSVNMDIDKLPNKYVLFARAAEKYTEDVEYTITGTGENSYPLTSPTGFAASDEVMVVIDHAGVRVYSVTQLTNVNVQNEIFPVFGDPVAFNSSSKLYYQSEGQLITDDPTVVDLQQTIRSTTGNSQLFANEMFVIDGNVLVVCFDEQNTGYRFFRFDLLDLATPVEVGSDLPAGEDFQTYIFTDGEFIYTTNGGNKNDLDGEISKYQIDLANNELVFVSSVVYDNYVKTTNTVVATGKMTVFHNGNLLQWNTSTGAFSNLGTFNVVLGIIFVYAEKIFYTNGDVAKKWEL